MKVSQIGAQLYTLRDFCKTPADLAQTLQKLRAIGYETVQVSGICKLPEEELVAMVKDNGLTICATHEPGDVILNTPELVVERLQKLGTKITAYPYPSGIDFTQADHIHNLVKKLEAAGAVLAKAGLTLCYHNHAVEFLPFAGTNVLDYIYKNTNPAYVQGEPDTYWVQNGGGDVVAWCERLKNRLPIIHLKDYTISPTNNQPFNAEVGRGNLDWKRILPTAEASGCQWYVVEQDSTVGDPFDSMKLSFDYLKSLAQG